MQTADWTREITELTKGENNLAPKEIRDEGGKVHLAGSVGKEKVYLVNTPQ